MGPHLVATQCHDGAEQRKMGFGGGGIERLLEEGPSITRVFQAREGGWPGGHCRTGEGGASHLKVGLLSDRLWVMGMGLGSSTGPAGVSHTAGPALCSTGRARQWGSAQCSPAP